jgi:hypothetical protein
MEENNMNENIIQGMITNLGNTIAQLNIDLAAERAQSRLLAEELEQLREEVQKHRGIEAMEAKELNINE